MILISNGIFFNRTISYSLNIVKPFETRWFICLLYMLCYFFYLKMIFSNKRGNDIFVFPAPSNHWWPLAGMPLSLIISELWHAGVGNVPAAIKRTRKKKKDHLCDLRHCASCSYIDNVTSGHYSHIGQSSSSTQSPRKRCLVPLPLCLPSLLHNLLRRLSRGAIYSADFGHGAA